MLKLGRYWPWKIVSSYFHMPVRVCCRIEWPSFLFDCFVKIWETCKNFLRKWGISEHVNFQTSFSNQTCHSIVSDGLKSFVPGLRKMVLLKIINLSRSLESKKAKSSRIYQSVYFVLCECFQILRIISERTEKGKKNKFLIFLEVKIDRKNLWHLFLLHLQHQWHHTVLPSPSFKSLFFFFNLLCGIKREE